MKNCETCDYYNTDRDEQPCFGCGEVFRTWLESEVTE